MDTSPHYSREQSPWSGG